MFSGNLLVREAGRLFKPHGVTVAQFNVLNLLSDQAQGMRPSELTRLLVVDASSTTYILDRMEAKGWLNRLDDPEDRRAWRIALTPAGQKLHTEVAPLYQKTLRRMAQNIDSRQISQSLKLLQEIQEVAPQAVDSLVGSETTDTAGSP